MKIRQVGLGLLGNACLTFVGYLDLISTSWNVEDNILLRRGVCDARKEKKRKILVEKVRTKSGRKSNQELARLLAELLVQFEKKWDFVLP